MVNQGQIIRINFSPQSGHEQRGTRPALVVSNDFFNEKTNMTIVCPITNTDNKFPLHVPLDERTVTTGVVLCEHIRSMDIQARGYTVIEELPADLLEKVLEIVQAQLEKE